MMRVSKQQAQTFKIKRLQIIIFKVVRVRRTRLSANYALNALAAFSLCVNCRNICVWNN